MRLAFVISVILGEAYVEGESGKRDTFAGILIADKCAGVTNQYRCVSVEYSSVVRSPDVVRIFGVLVPCCLMP